MVVKRVVWMGNYMVVWSEPQMAGTMAVRMVWRTVAPKALQKESKMVEQLDTWTAEYWVDTKECPKVVPLGTTWGRCTMSARREESLRSAQLATR